MGGRERPVEDLSSRNVKKNINLNARHLYRRTKARITKNWCPKIVSRLPDSWIRRVPLHVIDTPITYVEAGPFLQKVFLLILSVSSFALFTGKGGSSTLICSHAPAPHRAAKTLRNVDHEVSAVFDRLLPRRGQSVRMTGSDGGSPIRRVRRCATRPSRPRAKERANSGERSAREHNKQFIKVGGSPAAEASLWGNGTARACSSSSARGASWRSRGCPRR